MQQHDAVHLEAQVDGIAALLWPVASCIAPLSATTTLLKKLMFATRVAFRQTELAQFHQHALAAADVTRIALLLVAGAP